MRKCICSPLHRLSGKWELSQGLEGKRLPGFKYPICSTFEAGHRNLHDRSRPYDQDDPHSLSILTPFALHRRKTHPSVQTWLVDCVLLAGVFCRAQGTRRLSLGHRTQGHTSGSRLLIFQIHCRRSSQIGCLQAFVGRLDRKVCGFLAIQACDTLCFLCSCIDWWHWQSLWRSVERVCFPLIVE
jgi:hypothetical protein